MKLQKVVGNQRAKTNFVYGNIQTYENEQYVKIDGKFFKFFYDNLLDENYMYTNGESRSLLKKEVNDELNVEKVEKTTQYLKTLTIELGCVGKISVILSSKNVEEYIKSLFFDIPINKNMKYFYEHNDITLTFKILSSVDNCLVFAHDYTEILINFSKENYKNITYKENEVFRGNFDRKSMNVGGLSEEIKTIFERAFSTRLLSNKMIDELNIKHLKGIMLYGPPGCGKTLIARELGKIAGCKDPKIVEGPSLLNAYIGKSEENVRDLFKDAKENPHELHVIICDECDAIFCARGNGGGAMEDVKNNIVNQFLTMIDGPNSLNNILIIGMTNRLDLIDKALIRPGRIELLLEIKLPNLQSRKEIFNVYLNKINDKYKNDINIDKLSEMTENYTGAEIESCVSIAKSFAISKKIDVANLKNSNVTDILINQKDIEEAINDMIPAFGLKSKLIETILQKEFIKLPLYYEVLNKIKKSQYGRTNTYFFSGTDETVLSCICNLVNETEKGCIKFVSSEILMNGNRSKILLDTINDMVKVKTSTIILHVIENIIKYNRLTSYCDNETLQVIYMLLNKILTESEKITVIITTRELSVVGALFDVNKFF